MRREFRSLTAPDDAHAAIDTFELAGHESVPLRSAHGRVLATRIDAGIDVPGFDRAAMDGYAVRAADTYGAGEGEPISLAVTGTVQAGERPDRAVEEETAVEIATGAVLPSGADAVVPVERTREGETTVEIAAAVAPGDHVMYSGTDIASGDRALGPGTRLGPRQLGLLAALGAETVPVRARPQVAVVSTGEELVEPGGQLDPGAGQIYDVNSYSIAGAVRGAGGEPVPYRVERDDPDALRKTLERAATECSLVLTSGSTSAGSEDHLYDILETDGEKLVHGVALKPGRPLLVGRLFGTPYVGLPGYPVSALTVFRTFVAPAIREATGRPEPASVTSEATLATRVRYDGGRLRLLAVGLVVDGDGDLLAYAPAKGSGATTTLVETDSVVRMAPGTNLLAAGSTVEVERFDATDPLPALLGVGDPDPTLFDLLDACPTPRYHSLSPDDARRWFADGIPDVCLSVASAEIRGREGGTEEVDNGTTTVEDGAVLARWDREWGLAVPAGNPAGIATPADALAADVRFAILDEGLSLRRTFDAAFGEPAPGEFTRALPGIESAARCVDSGRADAGLALRDTAETLDLGFVSLGTQTLRLLVAENRRSKDGVAALEAALDSHPDVETG